jgi:hypothetical protein
LIPVKMASIRNHKPTPWRWIGHAFERTVVGCCIADSDGLRLQLLHGACGEGLLASRLGNAALGGADDEEPKERAAREELGHFSVQGIVLGLAWSGLSGNQPRKTPS